MTDFLVFSGHPLLVTNHNLFQQWVGNNPGHKEVSDVEDIDSFQGSIFSAPPPLVIDVESIKAGQLREVAYHHQDTKQPIVVISEKTIRGKFDNDGFSVINVDYPNNIAQRSRVIDDVFHIGDTLSKAVAKRADDPFVASVVSRQIQVSGLRRLSWSQLFIPQPKDTPPWGITNAIVDGDVEGAVREATAVLQKKSTTPQGLCMQITGFFTKVVRRDGSFFSQGSKQPKDLKGMVDDLAIYPDIILDGGKQHHGVCAYVASLASKYQ